MSASLRWIIHVDLDAFYASVEELLDPALRGKAIIVGGSPGGRGVVSSASYAARAYGVRSAMPVSRALRLCPHALVVSGHYDEYGVRSRAVMAILRDYTPDVEPISIDEAFLDLTGCERLWGPIPQLGAVIQRRILEEQSLPASLGIASSKLVAKIACDQGKPHGLTVVEHGREEAFLAPLPIRALWGVGEVTAERLRSLGVETIGGLAAWGEDAVVRHFGDMGHVLYANARGIDRREVRAGHERRSISQESTFDRDLDDAGVIHRVLLSMSEHLAGQLRARRLVAHTVRLKLRFPDFTTITRQATLERPTDQAPAIHAGATALLERNWRPGRLLRLVGVAVSGLEEESGYQLDLFEHRDQREIRLSQAVDAIRDRYGRRSIVRASLMRPRARKSEAEPTAPDEGSERV